MHITLIKNTSHIFSTMILKLVTTKLGMGKGVKRGARDYFMKSDFQKGQITY